MPIISFKDKNKSGFVKKYQVACKFCHNRCTKTSTDVGEASEQARKKGWTTVRVAKIGRPVEWACPLCLKDPKTFI